jgi:hypothetical protein
LSKASPAGRRFIVTLTSSSLRTLALPPIVLEVEANELGKAQIMETSKPFGPNPIRVVLRVRAAANADLGLEARYVRAELAFVSLAERAAGLDVHPVPSLSASNTGIFEVTLNPGRYSLEVRPLLEEAAITPVALFDDIRVGANGMLYMGTAVDPLDEVALPASQSPLVTGTLLRARLPESGLIIDALDPQNGRIVSTTTKTKCGKDKQPACGDFSLGLAPGVASFRLRVRRPEDPAYPTVVLPELSRTGPIPSATTSLPSLGHPAFFLLGVDAGIDLTGKTHAFDTISGANVVIAGTTRDGGWVRLVAHTNESGFLETAAGTPGALLYPGTYDAFIYPRLPLSDREPAYAAGSYGPFEIEEGKESHEPFKKTLSSLRELSGEVQFNGAAVPFARVTAVPVEQVLPTHGSDIAITDADGSFSMRLDPSIYRLTVEPPEQSALAWSTEALVDLRESEVSPTFNLSVPVAVNLPTELAIFLELEKTVEIAWYERREDGLRLVYRRSAKELSELVGLLPP